MSEPTDIDNDEEEFTETTLIEAIENQIESDNPPAGQGYVQQTDPGGLRARRYPQSDGSRAGLRDRRHAGRGPRFQYRVV